MARGPPTPYPPTEGQALQRWGGGGLWIHLLGGDGDGAYSLQCQAAKVQTEGAFVRLQVSLPT